MRDFLTTLWALSLGGAAVILVLAAVAHFSRSRYAARWRCWVWLILCLRLALPLSFRLPAQNPPVQLEIPDDVVIFEPQTEPAPQETPNQEPGNQPDSDLPSPQRPVKVSQSVTFYEAVGLIWGLGAAATVVWAVLSHIRFLSYVRRWGRAVEDAETIACFSELCELLELRNHPRLTVCPSLMAPMLAGLFSPIILLPEEPLETEELRYALLHELTHFKRRDIWLKSLCLLVRCLHWFNPAVWYMAHLLERDTELACDEAALSRLPQSEHGAYGRTILNAVERLKAAEK